MDTQPLIVDDLTGLLSVSKRVCLDIGDSDDMSFMDFEAYNLSALYKSIWFVGGMKGNEERGLPHPETTCGLSTTDSGDYVLIKRLADFSLNVRHAWAIIREIRFYRILLKGGGKYSDFFIPMIDIIIPVSRVLFNSRISDLYLVYDMNSRSTTLNRFLLSEDKASSDDQCKLILAQLLFIVLYLESRGLQHRDLTPMNVLLIPNGGGLKWKVIVGGLDSVGYQKPLGMERVINALVLKDNVVNNISYRPPEVLLEIGLLETDGFNSAYDIWSIGCLFARLLNRKDLFAKEEGSEEDQINVIVNILGDLNHKDVSFISPNENKYANDFRRLVLEKCAKNEVSKPRVPFQYLFPTFSDHLGIHLLERMLRFNPTRRYTATQALKHPYLSDYVRENPILKKLGEELGMDLEKMIGNQENQEEYEEEEVSPSDIKIARTTLLMEKFLFFNPELKMV